MTIYHEPTIHHGIYVFEADLSPRDVDTLRRLYEQGYADARRDAPALDVERLARAMEDVFPGWLDEAPGTVEAQAEMRDYARRLGEAYDFLLDSANARLVSRVT